MPKVSTFPKKTVQVIAVEGHGKVTLFWNDDKTICETWTVETFEPERQIAIYDPQSAQGCGCELYPCDVITRARCEGATMIDSIGE